MTGLINEHDLTCCITCEIMEDPVMTVDGNSYEREGIESWFTAGNVTSPRTGLKLHSTELIPNQTLRRVILKYKETIVSPEHSASSEPSAPLKPLMLKLIYPEGCKYDGCWRNDKEDSHGVSIWTDGRKYDGEWKDGKIHGRGVFTWANGDKYEGEYQNGKRNGRGKYTFMNGSNFEGNFVNGKRHGLGTKTYVNGKTYSSIWIYDKKCWNPLNKILMI